MVSKHDVLGFNSNSFAIISVWNFSLSVLENNCFVKNKKRLQRFEAAYSCRKINRTIYEPMNMIEGRTGNLWITHFTSTIRIVRNNLLAAWKRKTYIFFRIRKWSFSFIRFRHEGINFCFDPVWIIGIRFGFAIQKFKLPI